MVLLNEGKGANGSAILKPETLNSMFEDQMPILDVKDLGGLAVDGKVETTDTVISGAGLNMLYVRKSRFKSIELMYS